MESLRIRIFQIIVVFAVIAAALAGPVPEESNRVERQVVYSSVAGTPYHTAYSSLPVTAYSSGIYSGVSPYSSSVYGGVPLAYSAYNGVYNGLPAVRYY